MSRRLPDETLSVLQDYEWPGTATAETLGISVRTLYNRLHDTGYMDEDEGEDPE